MSPFASKACKCRFAAPLIQELHDEKVSTRVSRPHQPRLHPPPNVRTETLLSHACETLASLNVLTTDLARELEGSHRSLALSIQQLAVLGELLVNRALDNLDPTGGASDAQEVQP